MQATVKDIMNVMEEWAPKRLAESWDNPGLQVGNPDAAVDKILVSLDLTLANAKWAAEHQVDMIISHHPFFFHGMKSVDTNTERGQILSILLSHGISAYAAHTNLDTAEGGVNDALANALGLVGCSGFIPVSDETLYKLVVYVPKSHAEQVRRAMGDAGAGFIGKYSHTSFTTPGIGHFTAQNGAAPFLGEIGKEENAEEIKIETCVHESRISEVVSAMLSAHPYEEAVYDLYPLKQGAKHHTMGRVGNLPKELRGDAAVSYIKEKLHMTTIRVAGNLDKTVKRIAILGGAGAEFIKDAKAKGADLYLTGDVRYHEAQEAAGMGLILVDGGHFYTEHVIVPKMAKHIGNIASQKKWALAIIEDPVSQDIFTYY